MLRLPPDQSDARQGFPCIGEHPGGEIQAGDAISAGMQHFQPVTCPTAYFEELYRLLPGELQERLLDAFVAAALIPAGVGRGNLIVVDVSMNSVHVSIIQPGKRVPTASRIERFQL